MIQVKHHLILQTIPQATIAFYLTTHPSTKSFDPQAELVLKLNGVSSSSSSNGALYGYNC